MTDIVERLRIGRETCGVDMCRIREAKSGCTCAEAADEIERLREALRELVSVNEDHNAAMASIIGHHPDWKDDYLNKARAALGEGK